jgi:hypothetical protein
MPAITRLPLPCEHAIRLLLNLPLVKPADSFKARPLPFQFQTIPPSQQTLITFPLQVLTSPIPSFLQGVGVKVDDMGKLFAGFPRLLSYSVDRKLQPVVEFLASSGIKSEDIGRVVTRCPQLFCYSLEARLRPVLEFLKSIGVQEGGLAKVVLRAPHVLSRNVETVLKPAYESLIDMGFSPDKVRGGRQALAAVPIQKD